MGFCEDCVYGKKKRVIFLKFGKKKDKGKLSIVHMDVWGLSLVFSLGSSSYYVTFIGDAIRKTCIYCINKKIDIFDTFKKFKDLVKNGTGNRLKYVKFDNGDEY